MAESNLTPDQIERSKIRQSVKLLTEQRLRYVEKVEKLREISDSRGTRDWDLVYKIEQVENMTIQEMDAKYHLYRMHSGICIWFGSGTNMIPGAYGYSQSLKHILRGHCKGKRELLDVYCKTHRNLANNILQKEAFPAKSNKKPIPFTDLNTLKLQMVETLQEEHLNKVHLAEQELISAVERLSAIEANLAKFRDLQAEQKSDLKRRKLPEHTRLSIYKKYDFKCAICNVDLTLIAPHIDHIVPLSKGGQDILSNLQPLCGPCNLKKGAK